MHHLVHGLTLSRKCVPALQIELLHRRMSDEGSPAEPLDWLPPDDMPRAVAALLDQAATNRCAYNDSV